MRLVNKLTLFGEFMHKLRISRSVSIKEMCSDLDVGRTYLSLLECGSDERGTPVPAYLLKRIYKTYKLTLEECIELVDSVMKNNKDLQRLSLHNLSDDDKEKILSFTYWSMLEENAE